MAFLERLGAALPGGVDALQQLFDSLEEHDHAGRLIVAHYLADAQTDLDAEVRWDELALALVGRVTDADLQALHPTLTVLGFGCRLPAELQEQQAYGQMIVDAQERISRLIAEGDSSPSVLPKLS